MYCFWLITPLVSSFPSDSITDVVVTAAALERVSWGGGVGGGGGGGEGDRVGGEKWKQGYQ